MIEDAHKGKRQFLSGTFSVFLLVLAVERRGNMLNGCSASSGCNMSLFHKFIGKLHNLARAVADEESELNFSKGEGPLVDQKVLSDFDKDGVLGLGLRVAKQIPSSSTTGETSVQPVGYDVKDSGKRLFGPLSTKSMTYLSQFILHIAAIGDIVDGTDTTHDFNFFSLVYEWPKDVRFIFFLFICSLLADVLFPLSLF